MKCELEDCWGTITESNLVRCENCGKRVCPDCMNYSAFDDADVCRECAEVLQRERRYRNPRQEKLF